MSALFPGDLSFEDKLKLAFRGSTEEQEEARGEFNRSRATPQQLLTQLPFGSPSRTGITGRSTLGVATPAPAASNVFRSRPRLGGTT